MSPIDEPRPTGKGLSWYMGLKLEQHPAHPSPGPTHPRHEPNHGWIQELIEREWIQVSGRPAQPYPLYSETPAPSCPSHSAPSPGWPPLPACAVLTHGPSLPHSRPKHGAPTFLLFLDCVWQLGASSSCHWVWEGMLLSCLITPIPPLLTPSCATMKRRGELRGCPGELEEQAQGRAGWVSTSLEDTFGNSLVVRWLGLRAFIAGDWVQSGQELRLPPPSPSKKRRYLSLLSFSCRKTVSFLLLPPDLTCSPSYRS